MSALLSRAGTCLVLLGLVVACRPQRSVDSATSPVDQPATNRADVTRPEPDAVTLRPLDKAGYEDFLQQHRGQVILVDFWATWCHPCTEAFPDSVALSRKYQPQGLVVASLALEDLDDQPQVLQFLEQHQASLPNFISAYGGSDGRAMDEFELSSGAIPTLKLYDRQGDLRFTFGDGESFTFEAIEVAIRQLIADR